jgi:hypothetical protein
MTQETAEILKNLEYELFESEEYAPVRAILYSAPKNDGGLEDADELLRRVDEYTPGMQRFVDSFLDSPLPS